MKRVIVAFAILCIAFAAFGSGRLGFALDFGAVQDPIIYKDSFQVGGDFRVWVSDEFQIRAPISVAVNRGSVLSETGVHLVYYPWAKGPFMSLSLFQVGFSSGCSTLDSLVNLNEVTLGWTFDLGCGLFLEPSLSVRDPSGTFSEEYARIKGAFPCYTAFRGKLLFGWYFCEV